MPIYFGKAPRTYTVIPSQPGYYVLIYCEEVDCDSGFTLPFEDCVTKSPIIAWRLAIEEGEGPSEIEHEAVTLDSDVTESLHILCPDGLIRDSNTYGQTPEQWLAYQRREIQRTEARATEYATRDIV